MAEIEYNSDRMCRTTAFHQKLTQQTVPRISDRHDNAITMLDDKICWVWWPFTASATTVRWLTNSASRRSVKQGLKMSLFRAHRWALVVPALAVLTACGVVPGEGTPASSSSAAPPMDLHGAPHVASPLKLDSFIQKPCSVIAERQLQQLSVRYSLGTKSTPDNVIGNLTTCRYDSPNLDPNTSQGDVSLLGGGAGLSALYWSQNEDHTFPVFEPLTIEGYPAVNRVAKGEGQQGCEIVIGATDQVGIQVDYDPADENTPRSQSCPAAQAMATAVVQTIKANQ